MDSFSPPFEQVSTPSPRKSVESDENDCGVSGHRPYSSDGKKRGSKKRILAEINEFSLGNVVESRSLSASGERSSPGSDSGKPSLSCYDPVKNYLSPRPKYLRYKPDRRQEIICRLEKEEVELRESEESNSIDTPASPEVPGNPEDVTRQVEEETGDNLQEIENGDEDEEEDEGEENMGSVFVELLKLVFLLLVVIVSSGYMSNMNVPPDRWIEQTKGEKICWADGNFTVEGGLSEILRQERSYLSPRDRADIQWDFSFKHVRAVDAETQRPDAEEVWIRSNQATDFVINENCASGEVVVIAEAKNNEESAESSEPLDQTCREGADITHGILDGSKLQIENTEGGHVEWQIAETGDLEEVEVAAMEIHKAERKLMMWADKEVFIGLMESDLILKAVIGFAVSSLILVVWSLCSRSVWNRSSQEKKSNHHTAVVETKPECGDLKPIRNHSKEGDKNPNLIFIPLLSPSVEPPIIEEEGSVSIHSRIPTVELLGELVVGEISSSVKRSNVKKIAELEENIDYICIGKTYDDNECSSTTSRRLKSNQKITSPREVLVKHQQIEGGGEGSEVATSMTSTPVRRSSRIRNRAVQSP